MRLDDCVKAGVLVDAPVLQSYQPVFKHLEGADAVGSRHFIERHDECAEIRFFTVQRHGEPVLECELHELRLVRRILGKRVRREESLFGCDEAGIGYLAAFPRDTAHVVVVGIREIKRRRDRNAVLLCVLYLRVAVHVPLPDRRDDFHLRIVGHDVSVNSHLVIAFSRRAVGDTIGTLRFRDLDGLFRQKRARHRRREMVFALIVRVGLDALRQIFTGELFPHIECDRFHRTEFQGLLLDGFEVVVLLAEVQRQGRYLGTILVLYPLQHDGRIEPARVQK